MSGAARRWIRGMEVRVRARSRTVLLLPVVLVVVPLGLGLLRSDTRTLVRTVQGVCIYGSMILTVLLATAGPARDVTNGGAMLWLQKPVHPVVLYLDRLIPRLVLAVLVPLGAIGIGAMLLLMAGVPESAGELLQQGSAGLVLYCISGAVLVYSVSGLGLRPEALWAVILLGGLLFLRLRLEGDPAVFGAFRPLIDLVVLPIDRVQSVVYLASGRPPPAGHGPDAALWIVSHWTFWVGVGAVGSIRTLRSPFQDGD